MTAARHVGVDVGGTSVKAGALDEDGQELAKLQRPTAEAGGDPAALLDLLAEVARKVAGSSALERLGIGVPGLVDAAAGRVETSPNVPELAGLRLADELGARLGLAPAEIHIGNDANVAALGEAWLGAMAGVSNGMMITLGTGIGGGIVLGGDTFLGEGMAGEPGHLVVDPQGLACPCGSRGCLETLASASAASRRATELGLPAGNPGDLIQLTERALAGAGPESELCHAIGRDLGHGLALVVTLLDLRTFVIGGGFSPAFPALEPGIRAGLREWTFGARVDDVRLLEARLSGDAGWIGAARLGALRTSR